MLTRYETAKWLYSLETVSFMICAVGFIGYMFFGITHGFYISYAFLLIYLGIQHFSELL